MIFFTSDNHFSHANVITYCNRPFSSAKEMDERMIELWNSTVADTDEVYCLGDFSLSFKQVELFTHRLKGKKYLVPGNHDVCHSYHNKSRAPDKRAQVIKAYEDHGWIVLPEQTSIEIENVGKVNLCHLPYRFIVGDHHMEDKYTKWRPKDDGSWLLCGHVHNSWKTADKMINVGVDQWGYKPVSMTDIVDMICN